MKRILILFGLLLLASSVWAQDRSGQTLQFIYVAHDENTPERLLIDRLKEYYDNACYMPEELAVIFYLPNGTNPQIVHVNTPLDNQKDFNEKIIGELTNKRSHRIAPNVDKQTILKIFEEVEFLDDDGAPVYNKLEWIYYVNPSFWGSRYNETIISSLYFIFEMKSLEELGFLDLLVWFPKSCPIEVNEEEPFGPKSMCNCLIMPY